MNSLWMGNLEPYMNEEFICRAFAQVGETVIRVRLIRDKITSEVSGYGFVELVDETSVEMPSQSEWKTFTWCHSCKLSQHNPKRFKLSRATYGKQGESHFSLFVSDLTPDVDDGMLYEFFHYHFSSCCSGKIVLDSGGYSKCCGFVSFENERSETGPVKAPGCCWTWEKTLRLSLATNKQKKKESTESQNWQFHAGSYNSYNLYLNQYYYPQYLSHSTTYDCNYDYNYIHYSQNIQQDYELTEDDDLEYPDSKLNVMEANQRFMEQSEEFYSALIGCFFQPPESWDGVMCSVMCYLPEPIFQHEEMD